MLGHDRDMIVQACRALSELALGGTAVGTGLNAPAAFGDLAAEEISELLGYAFFVKLERDYLLDYLAIVRGSLFPESGTINAPLGRKPGSIIERTVDYEQGEPAVTHYQVVKKENGHSLISLYLETGRTHQIRIHMKSIGSPLIGDYLYNPDMEWIRRQALHSHKMSFLHPITRKYMEFMAPMPEDMQRIISYPI